MRFIFNASEVQAPAIGPEMDAVVQDVIELLSGDSMAIRFTELDETDPAGRFEIELSGGVFKINRATAANWASKTAAAVFSGGSLHSGATALGIIRIAAAVEDGETVTIGADVYEFDTHTVAAITAGRIRVDVSGGSTVAAQGTLTVDTLPTAGDTMTIGNTTYTFVASGDFDTAGEIPIAAGDLAATKVSIVDAINGDDGVNTANAEASAAAFVGNDCVLTALQPGTAGNSVDTTETFTAGTNVFDAATLGTTTAGVDPTAGEASDALIAAINASGTEPVLAMDMSANEILLVASGGPGVQETDLAETMAGTDNEVDSAAMREGSAVSGAKVFGKTRVPNSTEVDLGAIRIPIPFDPVSVNIQVRVTSTGVVKAWDGAMTITAASGSAPAYITLGNGGSTDWAATDTIHIQAIG